MYNDNKSQKKVIHRNFHPPITPIFINKDINKELLKIKIGNYKVFERFISRYRHHFNPRYIKSFKIVYLRDYLGFSWKHIAVLVRKKRTTCIKKYMKIKKNPKLLFKVNYNSSCLYKQSILI